MSDNETSDNPTIAVFQLSTGYEVPVLFDTVRADLWDHLTQALIGEIALPEVKRTGWDGAMHALTQEVIALPGRLSEEEKEELIRLFVWELVCDKWGETGRRLPTKPWQPGGGPKAEGQEQSPGPGPE